MVPIVEPSKEGKDKRKGKTLSWREAKLSLAHAQGSCTPVYAGSIEGGVEEAGRQLLSCAVRAGFGANSRVHAVGDGAPWIVGQIEQQFGDQGCYLIDFYHVCEYLGAASAAIAPDPVARDAWIETQKEALKDGRLDASCRRSPDIASLPKPTTSTRPCEPHRYLRARADQLNYPRALAEGLPIGSGEVESAHRFVAQQRLSGPAPWRVKHAEHMLALRINELTATGTPTGKPSPCNAALPPMTTAPTVHYAAPPERITFDRTPHGRNCRPSREHEGRAQAEEPSRTILSRPASSGSGSWRI